MSARMFKLAQIHQRIDERIRLELRKSRPDGLKLSRLKRMKLRAKDALHRLTGQPASA
uniref:YdcH family protein n=1 Tax=Parerythrobacter lutipelagi TaxID=1964208 RepID=UPI0010FA0273|nr:YdcH family protein [Parerythrobacter lutipelagi]